MFTNLKKINFSTDIKLIHYKLLSFLDLRLQLAITRRWFGAVPLQSDADPSVTTEEEDSSTNSSSATTDLVSSTECITDVT